MTLKRKTLTEYKPRVLIVDDNAVSRQSIGLLLSNNYYKLEFADSGPAALDLAMGAPPDVILLDIVMPEMDGFEVCRRLKSHEKCYHIPIILVTGLASTEDVVQGLEAGADEFLSKPVSRAVLHARVRSALRIKQQHDELRHLIEQRELLASMIVHDMRNPLAGILLNMDLLQRHNNNSELEKYIHRATVQTHYLQMFVNDLLAMAKTEQGDLALQRQTTDIIALVEHVVRDYQLIADGRKIQLDVSYSVNTLPLEIDVSLFRRVLDNLLENAVNFSPSGAKVKIEVTPIRSVNGKKTPSKPRARITVFDEGPGVPAHDRDRIFDKFEIAAMYQKKEHQQIGLGLAFCKMVTEAHGGSIYMTDNEPKGSRFIIEV